MGKKKQQSENSNRGEHWTIHPDVTCTMLACMLIPRGLFPATDPPPVSGGCSVCSFTEALQVVAWPQLLWVANSPK